MKTNTTNKGIKSENTSKITVTAVFTDDTTRTVEIEINPEESISDAVVRVGSYMRAADPELACLVVSDTYRWLGNYRAGHMAAVNRYDARIRRHAVQSTFAAWREEERRAAGNRGGGHDSDSQRNAVKFAARAYVEACEAAGVPPTPSAVGAAR